MFKNRILPMICCLLTLALLVTACGTGGDAGTATTAAPAATTAAATSAADAATTAAAGATTVAEAVTSQTSLTTATATTAAPESASADAFAEPVQFTIAVLGDDTSDYTSDVIYQEYAERFNMTWEIYTMVWDNWGEKCRLWINAGDMPDITVWNYNYEEFLQYVDAGMLRALPDGWETRYPTLADVQERGGIKDYLSVDGKQYMLGKTTFYHFAPVDKIMYHGSCIYRKDWLEKLGMDPWEDGGMITLDAFKEYIYGSINNNPDGLPANSVTGLTDTYGLVCRLIVSMGDEGYNSFYKKDGQYVWGATTPGTLEGIKLLQELYQGGYIDPDFYMISDKVHGDKFNAGTAAIWFDDMTAGGFAGAVTNFGEANPELGDPNEIVGLINVLGPDGKWHGTQDANSWSGVIFNPNNDDVKMERALAMIDYTATLEQQEHLRMGIEGVDYTKQAKGEYELLRPARDDGTYPGLNTIYPSVSVLNSLALNGDDFSFADPAISDRAKEVTAKQYENKELMGALLPYDYDYVYYASDAKRNYSGAIVNDEIVRIVTTGTGDIETEWQAFIDSQMPLVAPLLEELNTIVLK